MMPRPHVWGLVLLLLAIVERILWDATVTADGISGTVALVVRDLPREPALRPFTAVRAGAR